MARVSIDSGPVDPTDSFASTPRNRWRLLVSEKRDFLSTRLNYDCRCLVEFCQEANAVWQELGYDSAADMVRNGYELDPQEIEIAVAWLKINEPDSAIGIGDIKAKVASAKATKEKHQGKRNDLTSINPIEVKPNSNGAVLRRLARDCPEMLDKIEAGELSVNAAAIAAGIRKKPTQAEICVKAFRKAENRMEALRLITSELEPHEAAVVRDWIVERLH